MPANRILLVDDDPSGLAMLALSLRRCGLNVLTAASGEEALRVLSDQDCDFLVTDARMRPMDGYDLSLEARLRHPRLRIVMISALDGEDKAREYPIEKFFHKPVVHEDLADWICGCYGQA